MRKLFTLMVLAIVGSLSPMLADEWEVTYPVGGKASSVDDVQIKNSAVVYRYVADGATATLLDASGDIVKTLVRDDITLSNRNTYCTVDFEFNPAITEVGNYKISVPAATFSTTDGAENTAFEVAFSVEASSATMVEWNWTCVDPENGKGTTLEYVTLSANYAVDEVNSDATAQLYDASFNVVANLDATNNLFAYDGNLMVALAPAITTPGTYALVLNENSFVNTANNVTNEMAMIELTVEAPAPTPVEWTITWPTEGKASSFDILQIRCDEVAYRYLAEEATATVKNARGAVVQTLVRDDITLNFKGTYCTVEFEFDPVITDEGTYTLCVPQGAFTTNDGDENAAFEIEFTVEAASATVTDWTWTCVEPVGGQGAALEYVVLSANYAVNTVNAGATAQLYNSNFEVVANLDAANNLFPYDGNLMVALSPAITTPGDYMLVLNENAVVNTEANVTNAEAYIQLAVVASAPEYEVTAMPENNSSVETTTGIQAIYVAVSGYAYSTANESGIEMSITKDGKAFATVGASALSAAMDKTTLLITLPEEAQMTEVGTYVVTMPEGFFKMKSVESNEIVDSPEIVLTYYLVAPTVEPLSWAIDPEPGTINELSVVTITFNKPVKPAISKYVGLFYTDYSYFPETITEGTISVSEDGLVATIDFAPVFKDGGIFQVRLYEGNEQLAVVDGETFPGINITYKVDAPLYAECTPADGSKLSSLQETKIVLPRNTKIEESDYFAAWYVCGENKIAANLEKIVPYDFGDPSYIVVKSVDPITEAGEWKLIVEAGSLIIKNYDESMESPEMTFNYEIEATTGINAILNGEAAVDVYNFQGVCLKKNSTAADIQALPNGLYIIGGQKVYIK